MLGKQITSRFSVLSVILVEQFGVEFLRRRIKALKNILLRIAIKVLK